MISEPQKLDIFFISVMRHFFSILLVIAKCDKTVNSNIYLFLFGGFFCLFVLMGGYGRDFFTTWS